MSFHAVHSSRTVVHSHRCTETLREALLLCLTAQPVLVVVEVADKGTHYGSRIRRVRISVAIVLVANGDAAILVHMTILGMVAIAISVAEVVELFLWTIQISQVEEFVVANAGIAGHEAIGHAGTIGITHHAVAAHGEL